MEDESESPIHKELQQLRKLVPKLALEIDVKNMKLFRMEEKYDQLSTTLKNVAMEKRKLQQDNAKDIERLQAVILNSEKEKLELECQRKQVELRAKEVDEREIQNKSDQERVNSLMRELEESGDLDNLRCLETLNQTLISKERITNTELQEARKSLIRTLQGLAEADADIARAILVAGSNGYWNYRHQADVCHAYQVLKKGGLKDENIIVFMYDDIAFNQENPRPGIIINSPNGDDVYAGVPKDYTGDNVTVNNFVAALLGNKQAITGGTGKVLNSGPNDHIFIYYSDHGGPGVLGMPTTPYLYADQLVDTLKQKHASGTYKSLVFYVEACESGSIFDGLLPQGLNIYATTASNAVESSWGTYCPGDHPSPPDYDTCLGDMYSVAWMEDSESHNLRTETVKHQYELVKFRTANGGSYYGSHVLEFGDKELSKDELYFYMGTNPANDNFTRVDMNSLRPMSKAVNQRDADLVHFWEKFRKAPEGSQKKVEAQERFVEAMSHRLYLDNSVKLVGKLLFGIEKGPEVLQSVRAGQPLVDDWKCLRRLVRIFEMHCGALSQYGMKHMRSIANICNAGITADQMAEASAQACPSIPSSPWSSLHKGFSA